MIELDLHKAIGNDEADTYEAEMLQRPAAGQVQVEAKAIFALLPKTRAFHIAMGCGELLELKVVAVLEFQLMAEGVLMEVMVVLMAETVL